MLDAHVISDEEREQIIADAWSEVMEERYGIVTKRKVDAIVPSLLVSAENIRDMEHYLELDRLFMSVFPDHQHSEAMSEYLIVDDVAHHIVDGRYDIRVGIALVEERCRSEVLWRYMENLEKRIKDLEDEESA